LYDDLEMMFKNKHMDKVIFKTVIYSKGIPRYASSLWHYLS